MAERGNTTERGYGNAHQLKRAEYQKVVDAGAADCWRCGKAIKPGDPWDLGHDDHDRSKYMGPEHPACNRSAGAAVMNANRSMTYREW